MIFEEEVLLRGRRFTGCHDRPEKMAPVTITGRLGGRKMRRLISLTYRRLKRPQNYLFILKKNYLL
jgi:hypothetical protein